MGIQIIIPPPLPQPEQNVIRCPISGHRDVSCNFLHGKPGIESEVIGGSA